MVNDLLKNRVKKKDTYQSSIRSNTLQYRESEVDDDLAYSYYKKKIGIQDAQDLKQSNDNMLDDDYENENSSNSNHSVCLFNNEL